MNRNDLLSSIRTLSLSHDAAAFARIAAGTHASDLVDALDALDTDTCLGVLMLLPPPVRADLFAHFPPARQDHLLAAMLPAAKVQVFEHMPSDDRADLYNRLGERARRSLLPALAKMERDDILAMAAYPEGTAGAVATSDYAWVRPEMQVADAMAHLRATALDKETVNMVFVLDPDNALRGTVSLRDLVLADAATPVRAIMHADPVRADAGLPDLQAAELIRRYDLLALPVTHASGRMLGIVTVDDAMDIEKAQDATQLARFGGTVSAHGNDLDVRTTPLKQMFRVRVFWLAILTGFGILTSTFVAAQEELLSQVIVLAAFIAPIVDMGGNTGSQSATLVIRSMALGEVKPGWRDVWFVIRRELPVAAALGISIAVLEAILAWFSKGVGMDVLLVVGSSMLVCTALGGVIGALLPFAARRIGADPATLSSPMITSVMDLLGVFIYFGFAYLFLGDLLLAA